MGSDYTLVYGTTICNDGTVVVCGETILKNFPSGPDTFNVAVGFVARYSSSGQFISGFSLGTGNTNVLCNNVTVDPQGNMYVVGTTYENLTAYREYLQRVGFVAKISFDLDIVWLNEYGSGWNSTYAWAILYAPNDQLYISVLTTESPSEWENTQNHPGLTGQVGLIFNIEAGNGEILNGFSIGDEIGDVYLTDLVLLPSGAYGGSPGMAPNLIALFGNSSCASLDGMTGGVPGVDNAGGVGQYGFVWIFDEDLYPGPYAGIGSGNNFTRIFRGGLFTFQGLPQALIACGDTNEYLDNWMGPKGDLLTQGGRVGMTYYIVPGGMGIEIIPAASIGTEGNDTMLSGISSDYIGNVYISGSSNENVKDNVQFSSDKKVAFSLKTLVCGETIDYIQVGTGNASVYQYGHAIDILGNSYFSGSTTETLPQGPSLATGLVTGVHGFLAKSFTQPSSFNTPIFMGCDTSIHAVGNTGYFFFNATFTGTLSVDWGDGTAEYLQYVNDAHSYEHFYNGTGTYAIAIDVSQGDSITFFSSDNSGLVSLDVTKCPTLTRLVVNNNLLTDLDVAHCTNLSHLQVTDNPLFSLDVSYLAGLDYLDCQLTNIKILHLEKCGLSSVTSTTLENVINNINDGNTDVTIYIDPVQNSGFEGGASAYFATPAWFFFVTPGFPSLGNISYQFPGSGRGVAYGNGIFVAVGDSLGDTGALPTNVLVSIDGGKSFKIPTGITSNLFPGGSQPLARSVCYAYNGVWVVAGDDSTNASSGQTLKFSIDNAGTWNNCSGSMPGTCGNCVVFNNDRYDPMWMATGDNNDGDFALFKSSDGINWTGVDAQNGLEEGYAIAYGNGTWVVSGRFANNESRVLYTNDNFDTSSFATIPEFISGALNRRQVLAFGADQNGNAQFVLTVDALALVSSDGSSWDIAITSPDDTSHIWQPPPFANDPSSWSFGPGVAYYNKTWMFASGNSDKPPFFASDPTTTDQYLWSRGWHVGQTGAYITSYANGVAAGNKNWVVVGTSFSSGNRIISSTDGITWVGSEITPPVLGDPDITPSGNIYGTGTRTVNQTGANTFQWIFADVEGNPLGGNLIEGESSYNGDMVYNFTCTGTQTDTLTIEYSSAPAGGTGFEGGTGPTSVSIACSLTNEGGNIMTTPILVNNPPQTVIVDLDGLTFEPESSEYPAGGTYTFPSTKKVNISFINVPAGITSIGGPDSTLSFLGVSDEPFGSEATITTINPTQTISTNYIESRIPSFIESTGAPFSLTESSVITLTTMEPITSVRFVMK
jgi:hypothetical protein